MKAMLLALAVVNCPAGRFQENLDKCIDMTEQAARFNADMVVFPEMNLTGYAASPSLPSISRTLDADLIRLFDALAKRLGITILTGLAEKRADTQVFASHLVFSPDREYGIYRKIHTAPNEKMVFSSGHKVRVFGSNAFRFGLQLCYDAHFPELSTAMALKGADLILIPHASPRGTPKEKLASWMRHLSARAFDNGVFVGAVNQTGENGSKLSFPGLALVIGPDGNLISHSLDPSEHLHLVELNPEQLERVRSHRMRYFLPFRRNDLFPFT